MSYINNPLLKTLFGGHPRAMDWRGEMKKCVVKIIFILNLSLKTGSEWFAKLLPNVLGN